MKEREPFDFGAQSKKTYVNMTTALVTRKRHFGRA